MKRILWILLLIVGVDLHAQVSHVNESFESWLPLGWTRYTLGAGNGWIQSWQGPVAAHTGTHSAYSSISNSNCNNWLVSPPIIVSSADYHLTFWEKFDDIQYYVQSTVLISTSSGDPAAGGYQTLFQQTDTAQNWVQRDLDLSSYQGDTIYIAFQYVGTWHIWFVDDVFVGPVSFIDGSLSKVKNPVGISNNTGIEDVIVNLKNEGFTTIDSVTIDWEVNGINQNQYQNYSLGLLPGESIDLMLGTYLFDNHGQYLIHINQVIPGDFNPHNDSLLGVYTISVARDGLLWGVEPEEYSPFPGLQDVRVFVKNLGANPIDSFTVEWNVNGVLQPVYKATGIHLRQGDTTQATIGSYNFLKGVHEIEVHLKVIGDTNSVNDRYLSFAAVDTFWESFEGRRFPPENWSANFAVRDDRNFDTPPHGNYYYSALPDSNFFGVVSDTLYTPLLNIQAGDSLRFKIKTNSFLAADHKIIWKDGASGAIQVLQNYNVPADSWQSATIDLSPAAGVNYVGLVSWSQGPGHSKYDLITSDASVFVPLHDLSVENTDIYFLAREGQTHDFDCLIKNLGSTNVNGGGYNVKLMDESGVQLAVVNGVSLGPWEEANVRLTHTFPAISSNRVYVEIAYPQDNNPGNNQSRMTDVYVVPPPVVINISGRPDYPNPGIPFNGNGSTNTLGEDDMTQTLYSDQYLPEKGEIYGIIYPYANLLASNKFQQIPLKVWIAQTDSQDLDNGWIDQSELTLVYDDTLEILPGNDRELYIPFIQPVTNTGLGNIVVQVYAYDPDWPPAVLRFFTTSLSGFGPVRTIGVLDYFSLNPANPPTDYFKSRDFTYSKFVVNPIVETGQIDGVVYDETGQPLGGAVVSVNGVNVSVTADSLGHYALPPLPRSNYSITASSFAYLDSTEVLSLDTTFLSRDFYLEKRELLRISGTVRGSNAPNLPLKFVHIVAEGYSSDQVQTDSLGNFTLKEIYEKGKYEISLSLYGFYDTTWVIHEVDSSLDIGTIILRQEFISAFDPYVEQLGAFTRIYWKNPLESQKVILQNDYSDCTFSYTNEPQEHVWLGNVFHIDDTSTLTKVEIHTDVYDLSSDTLTIDIFDHNENLLVSSKPFMIHEDSTLIVEIPNIVVYDSIYAMLHWQNNDSSTHALCLDYSNPDIQNTAVIKYPGQPIVYLSDFFGGSAPENMAFHVRVHTLDDATPTYQEALTYNLYRGFASEFPEVTNWMKINSAPVSNLAYTDDSWTIDDSSASYRYAVETIYNEGNAELTFSSEIDWLNTVGFPDNEISMLNVFPNPTSHLYVLQLDMKAEKDLSITLYDVLGKKLKDIFQGRTRSLELTENVSGMPTGIYFLKIDIEGQLVSKMITIK